MPETPQLHDAIRKRSKIERLAYQAGYRAAIETATKHGVEVAREALALMVTSEHQQPAQKTYFLGAVLGDAHPCSHREGWPEFGVKLEFFIKSDDPVVIEHERKQLFEHVADPYLGS